MKSKKVLNVLPECYVDTNLIEYLLDAGVNHQHSCSKVVGQLKTKYADKFAVGIIDKDKVELGYVTECHEIAKTEHMTLMKHNIQNQYLITIAPAIDMFVIDCANEQSINTRDFGIPSDIKGFTRLSKSVTSNTDTRFKSLFSAIRNNSEIKALKKTLKYLCENKYQSDDNKLKELFDAYR